MSHTMSLSASLAKTLPLADLPGKHRFASLHRPPVKRKSPRKSLHSEIPLQLSERFGSSATVSARLAFQCFALKFFYA